MANKSSRWSMALGLVVGLAAGIAACGGSGASTPPGSSGTGGNGGDGGAAGTGGVAEGSGSFGTLATTTTGTGGAELGLSVEPSALQTITVTAGQTTPTVAYTATLRGNPVSAGWSVDRGDLGTIEAGPSSTATFVPRGTTGGLVAVQAGLNGETVRREILIKLVAEQNGADPDNPAQQAQIATSVPQLTQGGGIGGVAGEGLGGAIADPATLAALGAPAGDGSAQGLRFLYPYDNTVFPRGLLAPLLMWSWAEGDADAIQIELRTTSGSFSWKGTFGRPAILETTQGPFVRHPIPQDVWTMATNSAGGPTPDGTPDRLTVRLTVARGGQAYGPISETWTIAPARLGGVIYYNSYGTKLAENLGGAVGGNGRFGGAVLSIRVGDTGPALTAGASGDESACRVCHSVAADGSRLVVQHGDDNSASSAYDLSPSGATEQPMSVGARFPAVFPDGSMALSPSGQLLPLPGAAAPLPVTGLREVATGLGTPAFSPRGELVAFNRMGGTNQQLVVMRFDAATRAFSDPVVVVDDAGQPAETRPGWPAFFPDGQSVVFHHQTAASNEGNGDGDLKTRRGAKAHIAWTSITGAGDVTPLDQLNGKDAAGNVYLPKLSEPIAMTCTADGTSVGGIDADHGDDANLNYEPTVSPIAAGGYAWVVFTSRRLYGNAAVIPPFCSDPRGVDLVTNITTKKLWVAAIDLNAAPGTDASHPAFYLPGQELLAGNARGYWVFDPCKPDGDACSAGDECCGGYCQPGQDGSLVCTNTIPEGSCSQPRERCETGADCCDRTNRCINGLCTEAGPR
ncbi:hypothetical protein WMF31_02885 [Sorangium sp. So ce1036]|uniref:hypothetical protein n=1 Tax=Sorangium sp. So ce1036 TaxID=3133328 RepID=UPI003F046E81